tara:strand:+ start:422 stop:850 length:429 start_codon:yes stop_codon:yes gene_type:complete
MINSIDWKCRSTWAKSSYNTLWCLIGCSIGDFGTIIYFQNIDHSLSIYYVMLLAIINGIITSIVLETLVLMKQMNFSNAINTALKMSLISMIVMEVVMNTVDVIFASGEINIWIIPLMLITGFLSPLPYNYYRLKKYNESCH